MWLAKKKHNKTKDQKWRWTEMIPSHYKYLEAKSRLNLQGCDYHLHPKCVLFAKVQMAILSNSKLPNLWKNFG